MQINTLFIGSGSFAVEILKSLKSLGFVNLVGIITQPDKPVGRKGVLTPTDLGLFVQENVDFDQIPVLKPEKIRIESESILSSLNPDLIVVASYGQIIPKIMLEFPKYKCLNVHGSILPKLRGAVPVQMAILQGLKTTGVTLQLMSEKMDEGDIIALEEYQIQENQTSEDLMSELSLLGGNLITKTLEDYIEGRIDPIPQNHSEATYCYKNDLSKENSEITNETSVYYAERMVKAYNPWPIAWIKTSDGLRLQIYNAEVSKDLGITGNIGQIVRSGNFLQLILKDGSLLLNEVKLEGKGKMRSPEYLFLANSNGK